MVPNQLRRLKASFRLERVMRNQRYILLGFIQRSDHLSGFAVRGTRMDTSAVAGSHGGG